MRSLHLVPFLGVAALAAALLAACGGNSELIPGTATSAPTPLGGAASAGLGALLSAPTPYVAPSASAFPSPSVSATAISGLPSPSPAGAAP
jgi:hypothetical protein